MFADRPLFRYPMDKSTIQHREVKVARGGEESREVADKVEVHVERGTEKAFHFEGESEYFLEGSAHWDEPCLQQQRDLLRRSWKLQVAMLKFWELLGKASDEQATKGEYCVLHKKMTAVLAPELSEDDADAAADDDWREDAGGEPTITLSKFVSGLFSVADLWTDSVEEE
jgi:hypothetical protein